MAKKNPAALRKHNRAENFEVQQSEFNPSALAAQQISLKFGLSPTLAAVVAALAGLGPRDEVRT
jgi:hypothetical protein